MFEEDYEDIKEPTFKDYCIGIIIFVVFIFGFIYLFLRILKSVINIGG